MDASSPTIGHNQPPIEDRLRLEHSALLDQVQELADRANRVKDLIDAQGGIKSDDDLPSLVEIGKDAQKLLKKLDTTRLASSEDLRDAVKKINDFFSTVSTRVDRIKSAFAKKVGEYEDERRKREAREAAERARIAQEEAEAKLRAAQEAEHSVMGDVLVNEAAKAEQEAQMAARAAVKAGTGPTRTDGGTVSQSKVWKFEIIDSSKIPLDDLRGFIGIDMLNTLIGAYVRTHKGSRPLPGVTIYEDTKTSFR